MKLHVPVVCLCGLLSSSPLLLSFSCGQLAQPTQNTHSNHYTSEQKVQVWITVENTRWYMDVFSLQKFKSNKHKPLVTGGKRRIISHFCDHHVNACGTKMYTESDSGTGHQYYLLYWQWSKSLSAILMRKLHTQRFSSNIFRHPSHWMLMSMYILRIYTATPCGPGLSLS